MFSKTYAAENVEDISLPKSFRRDILRGYLQDIAFVFIDLARKRIFRVYTQYRRVNSSAIDSYPKVNLRTTLPNLGAAAPPRPLTVRIPG
jgi:hypothetical protein